MSLPGIALAYGAVVFGLVALPGWFAPESLASSIGLGTTGADGANEFRAVYGGLIGGIAVFLAVASARPAWHLPGLVGQLCVFAGMVAARAVAIASSGGAGSSTYLMLAVEAFGAAAALWTLRGLSRRPGRPPEP